MIGPRHATGTVAPSPNKAGHGVRRTLPNMKPILLALALLLLAAVPSNAALMSARDLLAACSGDAVAKAICDGYLMAVTDLVLRRETNSRGNGKTCVPATVAVDQVRDAVLTISQRGRAAQAPAGLGLVTVALRLTWPCEAAPQGAGQGAGGQPGEPRGQ